MIPFMIYMFLRKHGKNTLIKAGLEIRNFFTGSNTFVLIGFIIILLSLIPKLSKSQTRKVNYSIMQGGDNIGWLRLESEIDGNRFMMSLTSEVNTRMIFLIKVFTKETSVFENGKLLQSTQFRKNNGSIKLDKQTKHNGSTYEVTKNGEKERLSYSFIGANLLSLYFKEPVGIDKLYCDNHECFIKIIKMDDGGYKVKFPDGNSNSYYYQEGVCTKIKIDHSFYTATIIHSPKK